MGSSSDQNGLRGQDSLKTRKETVVPGHVRQALKHQEKFRGKNCIIKTSVGRSHELKQHVNGGTRVQQNASGNCWPQSVKENVNKDDKLVKCMTDLSGYRLEKGENLQDKALNIGVLDRATLEKWKYKTRSPQVDDASNVALDGTKMAGKSTVGSSACPTAVQNGTNPYKINQLPRCSRDKLTSSDGVAGISGDSNLSVQNALSFQHFETTPENHISRHKRDKWTYKLFDKNNEEESSGNQKITSSTGNLSPNSRYEAILNTSMADAHAPDGEAKKRLQDVQESDIRRKSLDNSITLSQRVPKSKLGSCELPFGPREKQIICNGDTKKRVKELQKMATDLSIQRQSDETDMEPHSLPPTLNRTQEEELLSDASNARQTRKNAPFNKMPIIPLTGEFSEKNSMEATDENLVETSKIFQERPEQVTKRGRHPSPNRRFSFSLGHMTRSFSLKDNASVPQLTSTYVSVKSGPISNDSSSLSAANKEKNGHQRGRSSTLRRLLDPLLKPIGLLPVPSAETDQSPKASLNPFSLKPPLSRELLQNGKDITSSIRGFLHFSRRNGLPFFRFVVNNKRSIFAAPAKNSASMGRNASSCSYSFYTIDEIPKKSSSWISHGTKEKRCDFLYNVVAQMNVNCSSFSSCRGQNSTNQYVEKEFVLCGAELRKTDQASPGFTSTRELAAAVVRVCGESSRLAIQRSCYEDMTAKGFSPCTPVKECSCNLRMNTTVIFPGGIHGLPSKGVPSPLIQRWKSGGSCDCGGWDVGCKLHVLCSENRHCHIPKESEGFLMSDHFELFFQGGAQQDKPIFSLTPIHNGVHLVEFDSSISSLQAFFICVTIISCQKPCDLAQEYTLSEDEGLCEPKGESEGPKNTNVLVPNKAPVSYTPSPPLSPVGRV